MNLAGRTAVVTGAVLAVIGVLGAGTWLFTLYIRSRVEAAVPALGRLVQVGGTRLHVVEQGAGPTLLLLHGLGAQLRNFHALMPLLAANFHVVCVDRPGCGYSTRPGQVPASLVGQAATIADLIRALRLDRPILVGHSYGGALALAIAVNHSDCVGGLALLAPLTHPQQSVPPAFRGLVIRAKFWRSLIARTIAVPLSMAAGGKILAEVFRPDEVPADFDTAAGGLLALRPQQFMAASADLVAVNDELPALVERYASIRVPVGIRFGLQDGILGYEEHGVAMQAKVPGLTLSLVDGGHMLPVSAPDETARWIAEFARRVVRARAPTAA